MRGRTVLISAFLMQLPISSRNFRIKIILIVPRKGADRGVGSGIGIGIGRGRGGGFMHFVFMLIA